MNPSLSKTSFYTLLLTILILAVAQLFSPFVFMKIGPGGYEFYGPDVPDIYIYGGDITGKDKSWSGINFAWKFQFTVILLFIAVNLLSIWRLTKEKSLIFLTSINQVFLVLFPLWIQIYISGVVNNSDGADLTLFYKYGWVLYGLTFLINGLLLVLLIISKGLDRKNS